MTMHKVPIFFSSHSLLVIRCVSRSGWRLLVAGITGVLGDGLLFALLASYFVVGNYLPIL